MKKKISAQEARDITELGGEAWFLSSSGGLELRCEPDCLFLENFEYFVEDSSLDGFATTITAAQELKKKTEDAISAAIDSFEAATGLCVSSVGLDRAAREESSDGARTISSGTVTSLEVAL